MRRPWRAGNGGLQPQPPALRETPGDNATCFGETSEERAPEERRPVNSSDDTSSEPENWISVWSNTGFFIIYLYAWYPD